MNHVRKQTAPNAIIAATARCTYCGTSRLLVVYNYINYIPTPFRATLYRGYGQTAVCYRQLFEMAQARRKCGKCVSWCALCSTLVFVAIVSLDGTIYSARTDVGKTVEYTQWPFGRVWVYEYWVRAAAVRGARYPEGDTSPRRRRTKCLSVHIDAVCGDV